MLPRVRQFALDGAEVQGVACIKADVADEFSRTGTDPNTVLQDLNIKVFEPTDKYICAIPGKMTEAPALARAAVDHVEGRGVRRGTSASTVGVVISEEAVPPVKNRLADEWIYEQISREDVS